MAAYSELTSIPGRVLQSFDQWITLNDMVTSRYVWVDRTITRSFDRYNKRAPYFRHVRVCMHFYTASF